MERRLAEIYQKIVCCTKISWLVSRLFQSGDFQEEQGKDGGGGDDGEEEKKCVFCVCTTSTVNTFYRLYIDVYRDVGATRIKRGGIFILCSGRTVNRYNA